MATLAPGRRPPTPEGAQEGTRVARLSRLRYGGPTRNVWSTATLSTSTSRILSTNPARISWLVVNRGVTNAAVGDNSEVTYANGVPMGAGGGYVRSDWELDGEGVTYELWAIAESGTPTLRIVETVAML